MSSFRSLEEKLVPKEKISDLSQKLRNSKKKIISTNGCFDILHLGHVQYLHEARKLGDVLVIAVNSDLSVRKLKGPSRPLNEETTRAKILAALECVDYVSIFTEDTPENFLSLLKPDIHVKGGDYRPEDLPEKKVVEQYGGKIQCLSMVKGFSTTAMIEKINQGN